MNRRQLPAFFAMCAISAMLLTGSSPAPQENTENKSNRPNPNPAGKPVPGQKAGTPTDGTVNSPAFKARAEMTHVWGEHLAYVRNYIVSSVAGLPDAQAVSNRLLQNADEIGRAVQPYYGDNASEKLATLMRDHVNILTELVQVVAAQPAGATGATTGAGRVTTGGATGGAASSDRTTTNQTTDRNMGGSTGTPGTTGGVGYDRDIQGLNATDRERFESAQRRLEANGKSIAAFLGSSNPNWKQANVDGMIQMQTGYVVDMITARVNGDWQADIHAFDQAIEHTFQFSSSLMQGIERQFPDRFAQASRE